MQQITLAQKTQQSGLLVNQQNIQENKNIQIIKCDTCGIQIEPNSYCPNCFSEIDFIELSKYPQYIYPKDKIEKESYYLFRSIGEVYIRQTLAYLEWVEFFYEKTNRNKIRVDEYRKIKRLSDTKNKILMDQNSICKCPKCKSEDIKWENISCPDKDKNCDIVHFGYRCIRCDNVFSK